ncbi:MAG TPA: hypothetical protein VF339_10210 [Gammaproteobacteria bacterium]
MNFLVGAMFVSVFGAGFLVRNADVVHPYFTLLPELMTAVCLLVVIGRVLGGKDITLDWRYVVFFALFFFVLLFGFLVQSMSAGAVISGLRGYVKFIPFFLLPIVYPFTPRQLKGQLAVLLTILLLQSPLAVYQRFVEFGDRMHTGDPVRGMATSSSSLSMLMVCVIVLLVSAYYRRRIRLPFLLAATAVFFLPTTLNETKGTLVMLPVALLLPAFLMPSGSKPMRRVIAVAIVGAVAGLAFVTAYDYFIQYREHGKPLETFFTEGHVRHYLYTGADPTDERAIGRFDSISLAVETISRDPITLAFGLGAGNVSPSSLPGFEGEYAHYFERYGVALTQITNFLWEVGFVGLAAYLLMYLLVFQDALVLARRDASFGLLGQVWGTVTVLMGMALFYKSVFSMNEIGYLFWFYSGVVASKACAWRRLAARRRSGLVRPGLRAYREAEA